MILLAGTLDTLSFVDLLFSVTLPNRVVEYWSWRERQRARETLSNVTVTGEEKHDEVVYIQIGKEIICQPRVPKLMKLNANTHTFEKNLCELVYSHRLTHSCRSVCSDPSLSGWCEVLCVPARAQVRLFIASGTQADLSLSACLICTHSPWETPSDTAYL